MATTQSQPSFIRRGVSAIWLHMHHLFSRRYRVRYQHNVKHLVADVFILLAVIALIVINGYIFLVFTKWAISLQVQVAIDGPTTVRSGIPVEYAVTVTNTARRGSLTETVLSLDMPNNFHLQHISEPMTDSGQITVGEIVPRGSKSIVISGVWWGNYAEEHRFSARANYRQFSPVDETLQWADERDANAAITIGGAAVVCTWSGPLSGVTESYVWATVTCKNEGTETIEDVALADRANILNGLPERSVPANDTAGAWQLGSLAANQISQPVALLVQLTGAVNTAATLPLTLTGTYAQQEWVLDQPTASIALKPGSVDITLTSNDQAQFAPQPAEVITTVLTIRNTSTQLLKNVVPVMDFSGSIFNRDTVKGDPVGEWQGDWFTWPAQDIPAGTSVAVTITAATPAIISIPQQQLIAGIIQKENDQLTFEQFTVVAQSFSSRLLFTALGRYYTREGEQIGLGPLPPLVGFPTRYRVFFEVASDRNTLEAVTVSGTLPKNVIWDADGCVSMSAGFHFDADSRVLSWKAGEVSFAQPAVASFCLTLNPLSSQVGTFAPLIHTITARGTDSVTDRSMEISGQNITTALQNDSFTAGRGRIIK